MSEDQRGFDWGPPTTSHGETFKEWGMYLFLLICIGGGAWLLIGSAQQGEGGAGAFSSAPPVETSPVSSPASLSNVVSLASAVAAPPPKNVPIFMIQLGVFGDEESAKLSYQKLKSLGYNASIALPDEQYEMFRLLMGPFQTEKEAETISRKLNELDFPCFVIESS